MDRQLAVPPPLAARVKLRQLALVVALAERRSLRQAASDIAMTQPAATKLLRDLEARFSEVAAQAKDVARESFVAELATLGPLAAPLLETAIARGPAEAKAAAEAAAARAIGRYVELLQSDAEPVRAFATEGLFGMGDLARPRLPTKPRAGAAHGATHQILPSPVHGRRAGDEGHGSAAFILQSQSRYRRP